jgi:hypothetical protein
MSRKSAVDFGEKGFDKVATDILQVSATKVSETEAADYYE